MSGKVASSSRVEIASKPAWPSGATSREAISGPTSPPRLAPAATCPNRRRACPRRMMSAMKLHAMEMTNRLKTLSHT